MPQSQSITVATSATELTGTSTRRGLRRLLTIYNNGSVNVYIGGADVTTTDYVYVLAPNAFMSIEANYSADPVPSDKWYAAVAASTSTVMIGESFAR